MKRCLRIVSLSVLLPLVFFSVPTSSYAAVISPDLLTAMLSAPSGDEAAVIINLAEKADISPAGDQNKHEKRARIIRALKDKAGQEQGPLKEFLLSKGARRIIPFWIVNSIAVTIPASVVSELADFPGVESIQLDVLIKAPPIVPAEASLPEWNITRTRAPDLWSLGKTGTGVVVANMDTGVDAVHPDLQSKWLGGTGSWFNPYSEPANSQYCKDPACCSNPDCPDPFLAACAACSCELSDSTPCDIDGHGTGTMGVMVGGSSGGSAIGVAPGAKWIAVKIFNDAGISRTSIILEGFQWLMDLPPASAPDVVNNSWEVDNINGCDTTFQDSINTLKAAGIAVVFAAGNSGPNPSTSVSPANNPGSFAVGATDINDNIAGFSSRGPNACDGSVFPHLSAPGVNIRLADLTLGGVSTNPYTYASGTSLSAPHVAGVMALILDAFPGITVPEIEAALKSSALDLGLPGGDDSYGYGLVNAMGAYNALLTSRPQLSNTGVFRPSTGELFLKNQNSSGFADLVFNYGLPGDKPVVGDWNGDGTTTLGVFRNGTFYLKNSNAAGFADFVFPFGQPGDLPIAGDWDGDGADTVGIYRNGTFFLRNSNSAGFADIVFDLGIPGDLPIAGDWTGKGYDTTGVFRPSTGQLFLKNTNTTGFADIVLNYGLPGDLPVVGDWDGDGTDTVGVYRNGTFFLRNSNSNGFADIVFDLGIPGDLPIAGDWDGLQ